MRDDYSNKPDETKIDHSELVEFRSIVNDLAGLWKEQRVESDTVFEPAPIETEEPPVASDLIDDSGDTNIVSEFRQALNDIADPPSASEVFESATPEPAMVDIDSGTISDEELQDFPTFDHVDTEPVEYPRFEIDEQDIETFRGVDLPEPDELPSVREFLTDDEAPEPGRAEFFGPQPEEFSGLDFTVPVEYDDPISRNDFVLSEEQSPLESSREFIPSQQDDSDELIRAITELTKKFDLLIDKLDESKTTSNNTSINYKEKIGESRV